MSDRATLTVWLAALALWVALFAALPALGTSLLRSSRFRHPDPRERARALTVRALHRWEQSQGLLDAESPLRSALADLEEAGRLSPDAGDTVRQQLRERIEVRLSAAP